VSSDFAKLVSLACHDLRTPLATVRGFAKTLQRDASEEGPQARYLELIDAASAEMTVLLDLLGLVARVESGRQELTPIDSDTGQIAREAAEAVGGIEVSGEGEEAPVDAPIIRQALAAYGRALLRHGGLERAELRVEGSTFAFAPVDETLGPILLGDDLKDLGAAASTRVLRGLGGSVAVTGGTLVVVPPAAA
jgi:signal transduction histidine kinase